MKNRPRISEETVYNLDEFHKHINLWKIIKSKNGKALAKLRVVASALHASCFNQLPSIYIHGQDAELWAMAFANTICREDIRITNTRALTHPADIMAYFANSSRSNTAHIIKYDRRLVDGSLIYDVTKNRIVKYKKSYIDHDYDHIAIDGLIILISERTKSVPDYIFDEMDFIVHIEDYTQEQLVKVVEQRFKFCSIDHDQDVPKLIFDISKSDYYIAIELVRLCIMIQSESKQRITNETVKKAQELIE